MPHLRRALRGLLLLGVLACGAPESATPGAADDAAPLHRHRDARFEFTLAVEGTGGGRALVASVVPRGAYHLSVEYPARLELSAPGLALEAPAAGSGEERSEQLLRFRTGLPERAADAGGAAAAKGRLRIGVCRGDELCEPVDHAFRVELP